MKVHVISETPFIMKATGVHTAFIDHVGLLKENGDLDVVINNEGKGDIFHCHTYGPYYFWKGRKYKGKRIFTAHVIPDSIKGSFPNWQLLMPFVKTGLKIIYSYADVCIAISPMVEQAIQETGAKTKIVRIGNPVNTDLWKRSPEKRKGGRKLLGIGDNEFVVIGVGQVQPRKGIEDFMDIAEEVPEATFVWAGGRPFRSMTEAVNRINQRILNAPENFSYAGSFSLEMMPIVYAAADLMLFPSYQENSPLAPIEAAACGMPVIFRDIAEYQYLYENPYLKASDTSDFIRQTKRMINDEDFFREGTRISEILIQQFEKEAIRKKLVSLYESLINN
jgi:1,2-diacylglycerol-3-alpha-glucose alpha-1,2-galactosyltransferase